jgi:tripartite-type tricarboxylate transporter receptor subunit TctC/alkylation response protein AidB-like acyl-CoA dehydrogenase
MEFALSDDQRLMQDSVRSALARACPLERVRAAADGALPWDPSTWSAVRELGVTALLVPEAHGGLGLSLLDAALAAEELGRRAAPVPYLGTSVLAPLALRDAGSESQQSEWLPALAGGDAVVGVALTELLSGARDGVGVRAEGGRLHGSALFVVDGAAADAWLVAAGDASLHLLRGKAKGVQVAPLRAIDATRPTVELRFDGAEAEPLPGSGRPLLERLRAAAWTILAADALGAGWTMIEQSVAYAHDRRQFGRAIGSFQAVKHLCAEMAAELEIKRALVWYAAHLFDEEPAEAPLYAAHAKALLGDAGHFVARTAIEVHGGWESPTSSGCISGSSASPSIASSMAAQSARAGMPPACRRRPELSGRRFRRCRPARHPLQSKAHEFESEPGANAMTPRSSRPQPLRRLALGAAMAALSLATLPVGAQTAYPSKPITLIVPFPAGGPTDIQLRALGNAMSKQLKQPVVVMNQPGAAGTMAPGNMARTAAPDGYTISAIASSLYRLPHIQSVPYDTLKDFTYIAAVSEYVFGVAVAADSPYKTAQDLVAAAKAKPGQLNVGAISNGSSGHAALLRWGKAAGFQANAIPYKGGADAIQALLGGHIDALSESGWATMAQQGKVRPLAIYSEKRNPYFANVPTMKELGWDVVVHSVFGIAGPKGMDPKIVQTLQDSIHKATEDPDFKKTLELSSQPTTYMSSSDYTRFVATQFEAEKRIVQELKAAGVNLSQ